MNFTQPPPNFLPLRTPTPMNLNQTKFTNQYNVPGRHTTPGSGRYSNHSFGPRHKAPPGQQPNIPSRHFVARAPGPCSGPRLVTSQVSGQMYQANNGQYVNSGQVLKHQNGFHGTNHSQVNNFPQNMKFGGPGLGIGQNRPQNSGQGHQNGVFQTESGAQVNSGTPPTASSFAVTPRVMPNGTIASVSPGQQQPVIPTQLVSAGVSSGSQSSASNFPTPMSTQCMQLPYNVFAQQGALGQISLPPGLLLQQSSGPGQPLLQGGPLVHTSQTPQGVQLVAQPGEQFPAYSPVGQDQALPVGTPGVGVPIQYMLQGQPNMGPLQAPGVVGPYMFQPQSYSTIPSVPQVVPGACPPPAQPPPPVPPTPPSANIPMTQFPPPGLFSQPPPNYLPVSPAPRQVSPRYHTPPKSPCPTSPVYLSPPMQGLVPVFPLTPGPTPDCVPCLPTSEIKQEQSSGKQTCVDIPDLRHQFLTNQFLPQPGQVVLLPPLPPDRSVQTIQLLTPGLGGQFNVQTIVLPIIKVENTQSASQVQGKVLVKQEVAAKKESEIVIKTEDDNILLNEVDATGLPKVMQGIDLEQVKQFAAEFKSARLSLGLTQTQVGQALTNSATEEGIAVSQSTICRFEKLEITALQVKKLLPALQTWLQDAKERHKQGLPIIVQDCTDGKDNKKRKKRTVFNQDTVNALCVEFERQPSPSSAYIADIADRMGLDKETVRVWFCNKRQNLKKNLSGTI